jgi:hypothetical protein
VYPRNKKDNKRACRIGFCVVKFDMHKAYDGVEWIFLRDMVTKLGFHCQWTDLVMECVTPVTYPVMYNSQPVEGFTPT